MTRVRVAATPPRTGAARARSAAARVRSVPTRVQTMVRVVTAPARIEVDRPRTAVARARSVAALARSWSGVSLGASVRGLDRLELVLDGRRCDVGRLRWRHGLLDRFGRRGRRERLLGLRRAFRNDVSDGSKGAHFFARQRRRHIVGRRRKCESAGRSRGRRRVDQPARQDALSRARGVTVRDGRAGVGSIPEWRGRRDRVGHTSSRTPSTSSAHAPTTAARMSASSLSTRG